MRLIFLLFLLLIFYLFWNVSWILVYRTPCIVYVTIFCSVCLFQRRRNGLEERTNFQPPSLPFIPVVTKVEWNEIIVSFQKREIECLWTNEPAEFRLEVTRVFRRFLNLTSCDTFLYVETKFFTRKKKNVNRKVSIALF